MKSGKDIWGIVTEDPAAKEGKETITIEMTETRTVRRTISVTKEELALIRTGELPVWVQECCLGEASGLIRPSSFCFLPVPWPLP